MIFSTVVFNVSLDWFTEKRVRSDSYVCTTNHYIKWFLNKVVDNCIVSLSFHT